MKKKSMLLVCLILILTLSAQGLVYAATDSSAKGRKGIWYTPKYQDEFRTAIDFYTEGFYVGMRYTSRKSYDGYITIYNENLEIVKITKYTGHNASGFHDGLMAVSVRDTMFSDPKFGFMNTAGKEILPCKYVWVSNFKNGVAVVQEYSDKTEDGFITRLINKKGETLLKFNYKVNGDVRDSYVVFDAVDESTIDPNDVFSRGIWGLYYDFSGKLITVDARKNTYDDYGYWDENGERRDLAGYYKNEEEAFLLKYGDQYESVDYLGKGFFRVQKKINRKLSRDKIEELRSNNAQGVVVKNNKTIVPMAVQEIEAKDTETSKYFEVIVPKDQEKFITEYQSVPYVRVYSSNGKKLCEGQYYVYPTIGEGIYYSRVGNQGWGLISMEGKEIVKYSKKLLSVIWYGNGWTMSYDEYVNGPKTNITFYTTADTTKKGDVKKLKSLLSEANKTLKKLKANGYSAWEAGRLTEFITYAKKVIASKNPTTFDVTTIQMNLEMMINFSNQE